MTSVGSAVVVAIDTSVMPAVGTQSVVPPDNSSTSYTLTCDAIVSGVIVNTNTPVVTMNIPQGTNLEIDPYTGRVDIDVEWTSENTDSCSVMYREVASDPGVLFPESTYNEYTGAYDVSGSVHYDGNPRSIDQTSTFYISCSNSNTGETVTSSITLTVAEPPPLPPPTITMWSPDAPSLYRDELYGYAFVDVGFTSSYAQKCVEKAYDENGVEYYPLPRGWGSGVYTLDKLFTNIQLATTTIFEVTCWRNEVTIGATTYPEISTSSRLRIDVFMPLTVSETFNEWDRTYLPSPLTVMTPSANPAYLDAITGASLLKVKVQNENASNCLRTAYYSNGTPGDPSDDTLYTLDGWSGHMSGNGTLTMSFELSSSTRLQVYCFRQFDLDYGTVDEILNGTATTSLEIEVIPSAVSAPAPVVSLYGSAVADDATTIWANAIAVSGFDSLTGSSPVRIENTSSLATSNSIVFPFTHPYGATDIYDIYVKVCDESDGESTFRVYSESSGFLGSYTTNDPASPHVFCGDSYGTIVTKKIASGVGLVDGEKITVECDTPANGEHCGLADVLFGAGEGGVLVTSQVNPLATSVDFPLFWVSENTTTCELFDATEDDGTAYTWYGGGAVEGLLSVNISTSTTFSVTCGRVTDSLVGTSLTRAAVPYNVTFAASTVVGSGECIDPSTNSYITALPGYGPDPVTFECVPQVDLAAASPSVSILGATEDNINGVYDNLDVLMFIENIGPGELPLDSGITYKAEMTFLPIFTLPTLDSAIGTFNVFVPAPVSSTSPTQSQILTRTFNGIPFGTHTVCAIVNLDGSPNFPEASADPTNNTHCTSVTLPVPRPPMSISTDRQVIRKGQSVTVGWSAHTTYTLNCEVRGPGGVSDTFDASDNYPSPPNAGGAYTSSTVTPPLNSTGEFVIQCTEPITGTVFTDHKVVEVVPDYIET